jgi:proteasome lid subunit RPN8/RPN11
MSSRSNRLVTPIYPKSRPGWTGPAAPCFYLLTSSGLFIGRDTPHARSLVPAPAWPAELEPQESQLELRLPRVPADLVARMTTFFRAAAARGGAEAIVLLALDGRERLRPIVPRQVATVGRTHGGRGYPIGLRYQVPAAVNGRLTIVGDVHSHANEPAFASTTDVDDERYRPGLHLVAGRLHLDRPQWHAEYVVDGARFALAPQDVMDLDGGGAPAAGFSPRWMSRLDVRDETRWAGRATWH